ncbi:hypothetical protein EAO12_29815 [Klebsiella pneumoniae]|nr:hypothetical protein EAO12_29815 [Klebsiella pneumoniae]
MLKRAAIAIQQMSGKGVISMEELRQQLGELFLLQCSRWPTLWASAWRSSSKTFLWEPLRRSLLLICFSSAWRLIAPARQIVCLIRLPAHWLRCRRHLCAFPIIWRRAGISTHCPMA